MFGIDRLGRQLNARLDAIERMLNTMATRADLDQAKAELSQAIQDATNRVVSTIADLQSQIANGSPVTDQDLADLKADVQSLANIDAAPAPAPGPAPGP